jgi:two-component system LytT family sensor kinase
MLLPRIRLVPATLLLWGLVAASLSLAHLVRGATAEFGDELYVMYAAGAVAAWACLPLISMFSLRALELGPRSLLLWSLLVPFCGLWSLLTHLLSRSLYTGAAIHFGLPSLPTSLWQDIRLQSNKDLVTFAWLASAWTGWSLFRERKARELHTAELEASLQKSRLSALSAQLNPHFFFNAMNTVSAMMYEDLPRTERLIQDLGDLLRSTLEEGRATWYLGEECAHGARFVRLLEARFAEKLTVHWSVPESLARAVVPRFVLQTLIENSAKHNQGSVEPLRIDISCARTHETLTLSVRDDGRGFDTADEAPGTGLRRLTEMLELLHGSRASLRSRNLPQRGAEVEVSLPFQEAA